GVDPAAAARRSSSSRSESSAVTRRGGVAVVMGSAWAGPSTSPGEHEACCGLHVPETRLWTISGAQREPSPTMKNMPDRSGPSVPLRAQHRSAAFFDLDKTIIAKSSSLAFSKPFQAGGLITRGAMLRSAYAQFVYLVGGADHDQMEKIRAFMSQLVEGWDVETVKEIVAETLHHVVDPIVYDEAVSLMDEHRSLGRDVVIVSTRGT